MKDFVTQYNLTGVCPIDIDAVVKQWTWRCWLSQFKEQFTIFERYDRRHKPHIRVSISTEDAMKLIEALKLVRTQSPLFNSAGSWRRAGEFDGMKPPAKEKKVKTVVRQ